MSKPPKVSIPGLNRGAGIPPGFAVGRRRAKGKGPAELLDLNQMRGMGLELVTASRQQAATVASTALSSTTSLSSAISTALASLKTGAMPMAADDGGDNIDPVAYAAWGAIADLKADKISYVDGPGNGAVPNPTGWVTGEWRIMPPKDFVVENANTHVFLEFDPDTYTNGVMWGSNAAFSQVWGLGIPSASGRFQLLGSAAFEFIDPPYYLTYRLYHEANLIFGSGLSYDAGTSILTSSGTAIWAPTVDGSNPPVFILDGSNQLIMTRIA